MSDPGLCDLPVAAGGVCLALKRVGPKRGPQKFFLIEVVATVYLASSLADQASDPAQSDRPGVVSTEYLVSMLAVPESGPQMFSQPGVASAERPVLVRVGPVNGPVK